MYAIYGNIYHQYTPNVSIYTIHGSYGVWLPEAPRIGVIEAPPGDAKRQVFGLRGAGLSLF